VGTSFLLLPLLLLIFAHGVSLFQKDSVRRSPPIQKLQQPQPQPPAHNWCQQQMQEAVHGIQGAYGTASTLPSNEQCVAILEDAGNAPVKAALAKIVATNPEWFFEPKLKAVKEVVQALA